MERKKNPERHARGYTFRGGSQRIGPADLYIFRAQTKKRWHEDLGWAYGPSEYLKRGQGHSILGIWFSCH